MPYARKILVLSEDRAIRETLLRLVPGAGIAEIGNEESPGIILIGCRARIASQDLNAARTIARAGRIPILLITSEGSEELAVEALRNGVTDYLRLPLTSADVARAMEASRPAGSGEQPVDRMVGVSQAIRDLKTYLRRVAASQSSVLITGETGTGKELAADFIHRHSPRADRPMITINCAAIPDSLIESELFGFERGSFTGAHAAQSGKFKLADGGDIFLDEIGDFSPWAQAKVLRVIETGEIQRLGARRPERVDVRVIAATNRDLENDSSFRKDLYFRLNVARVRLPPLRERQEDILPIADCVRAEFDLRIGCRTSFTDQTRVLLLKHSWPGNIRELRNIVEAAFVDPGPEANGALNLPPRFAQMLENREPDEAERILLALSQTHWNKSRAAAALHWSRMTLYRKMARYQIGRCGVPGDSA